MIFAKPEIPPFATSSLVQCKIHDSELPRLLRSIISLDA